ncbi:MAG: LamG-like jellyroll fold domain-containing protein, partial [Cyclobacteriaceae bacterium]
MRTKIRTTKILLFSVFLLLAVRLPAQQLVFDGKDDYALANASTDLQIAKNEDFTFEFFINPGTAPKKGMALLAVHDGKFGIVCAIDRSGVPYLIINTEKFIPEKPEISEKCHHLVFARKGGELYLIIDGRYYGMGPNTSALSTYTDIVIGNSPNTSEGYYQGAIEEIRLWNKYRREYELEEYRYNCLIGDHDGLIAHWNITEQSGQYANDMVGNLHARWGDKPLSDAADPALEENNCVIKENCCDLKAEFAIEGSEDQYVFSNQSGGGEYAWYIDGVFVSDATDLLHTFTTPGTYLITLEANDKNGCRSKRTVSLTIDFIKEIDFCGEFEKSYNDPAPFSDTNLYYDRFGNRYTADELLVSDPSTNPTPLSPQAPQLQQKSLLVTTCDCQTDFGINTNQFELYFEDCERNTGTGFDDPTVSGTSTLGRERRRTVCQVYADLSSSIL